MEESYPRLTLEREERITEKRKGGGPRPSVPADPAAQARGLIAKVEEAVREADSDLGGFDDRRLFRFEVPKGAFVPQLRLFISIAATVAPGSTPGMDRSVCRSGPRARWSPSAPGCTYV